MLAHGFRANLPGEAAEQPLWTRGPTSPLKDTSTPRLGEGTIGLQAMGALSEGDSLPGAHFSKLNKGNSVLIDLLTHTNIFFSSKALLAM